MKLHLHFSTHLIKLNLLFYFIVFIICNHLTNCQDIFPTFAPNSVSPYPLGHQNRRRTSIAVVNAISAPPGAGERFQGLAPFSEWKSMTSTPVQKATRTAPAASNAMTAPSPGPHAATTTFTTSASPVAARSTAFAPGPYAVINPSTASYATASPSAAPSESALPSARKVKFQLSIGAIIGIIITAIMIVILCSYLAGKKFSPNKFAFWKRKTKNSQSVETFLKNHESLILKRYKYSDIKKMTNSFQDKLGHGAYGDVFRGKLFDGRMVAVKVLKESKGDGEEFINEVASISRTSHVNIVTFLGFCIEDSKRALIYEFMPNGSLEKFIYDENPSQNHPHLEWEALYKIAIGIARGLEYLHRGCNTRIVHFDIKPHNILLDQDFCPKISDFGLAKLCLKKESIVSMIGARGTPGYIAPELINRNFGGVSHKSDVYSYGMMVLEMVGGRKNLDAGVENISEIYFPHWIHKRLNTFGDLGLRGVTSTEDKTIARKMILVGLWCIQMDPSSRPGMSRVLEMLEGNLEALQIPPMPCFTSPSRSQTAYSTTSSSVDEIVIL